MKKRNLIFLISVFLLITVLCGNAAGEDFQPLVPENGDLNIHFLELGNKYTGDCIYINYGDTDILIDAGSKQSSASTIKAYIDNYIQDDKIEFVIATHAHEDHIAGFGTTTATTGILDSYEIGTIIDFPRTNSRTVTYNRYVEARDRAVSRGTVHYTALQCYNNEDGASRIYDLGGGVKLEILYNYYYENYDNNENNYSVCVKIINGEYQYLFTGDLEKKGEDKLVEYYDNLGGLGHCILYKGGHHGSYTSSNEKLLEAISPEYVCVCTCAGSTEYSSNPLRCFPSQDFVERVAPYTDKVYITTLVTDFASGEYLPLNGNIMFNLGDGNVALTCSNNDLKLKDTEWFLLNREMPDAWKQDQDINQ